MADFEGEVSLGIVLMTKSLGFSEVKSRLRKAGHPHISEEFFKLSLRSVQETLRLFQRRSPCPTELYLAIAEQEAVNSMNHPDFSQFWQGPGGFSTKISHAFGSVKFKHDFALIVGMDSPQMSERVFLQATMELKKSSYVLGPSKDGGFYLFGSRKTVPKIVWDRTNWSTASTLDDFAGQLNKSGTIGRLQSMCDVDSFEDLSTLACELRTLKILTESQKALLSWLDRPYISQSVRA